jgi:hypothetical protein
VGQGQQANGQAQVPAQVTERRVRFRLAVPAAAVTVGIFGLVLLAAWALLSYVTGDIQASRDGVGAAFALVCGLLGVLVARRQPRNPEGWLLLGMAVGVMVTLDSGLYAVLDYRLDHGRLPLGGMAVFLKDSLRPVLTLLFALVILLFPDGKLPRRWTWVLRSFLVLAGVLIVAVVANEAGSIIGRPIQVDVSGGYSGPGSPAGVLGVLAVVGGAGFFLVPLLWAAFITRQVLSWRRSSGERRQQLKWLMAGAVIAVAGLALLAFGPPRDQTAGRVVRDLAIVALAALPLSMGVGILKFHLYDIDRVISRTLSYALLTGVLAGVYVGVITLATQVLPFSSPVGVAASTLVAAALFNPVRRRIQRAVDRRFNRARYDADKAVAAFASGLNNAVGLDSVRERLVSAVQEALEPAHASVWICQSDPLAGDPPR